MNYLFVQAANRRKQAGALARLTGSPLVDTDTPLAERLTRLLDERESAMQAWETDELAFVEHKLERWDEARAAQKAAEQPPPSGLMFSQNIVWLYSRPPFFQGRLLVVGHLAEVPQDVVDLRIRQRAPCASIYTLACRVNRRSSNHPAARTTAGGRSL
jgi:hypothetical protein